MKAGSGIAAQMVGLAAGARSQLSVLEAAGNVQEADLEV